MKELVKRAALCGAALVMGMTAARAVEIPGKKIDVKVGGDFVSSYIWRGSYQTGASMQPTLGFSVAGFSLTAWGSTDFRNQGHKEVDITAAYSIKGFTVAVTDYSWSPNGAGDYKYFNWQSHETNHYLEGSLTYVLPIEKFPLTINWNTMFFGADKKANGKTNYSTYVELSYPFRTAGRRFRGGRGFHAVGGRIAVRHGRFRRLQRFDRSDQENPVFRKIFDAGFLASDLQPGP